jgi:hypothetical protein
VAQTAGDPLTSLSGGLLPVLNDAMPDRLVPALREFLVASAGAVDVGVLLADYELSQLRGSPRAGSSARSCRWSAARRGSASTPRP